MRFDIGRLFAKKPQDHSDNDHRYRTNEDGLVVEVLDYNAGTKVKVDNNDVGMIKKTSTQDTTIMINDDRDDHDIVEVDLETFRQIVPAGHHQEHEQHQEAHFSHFQQQQQQKNKKRRLRLVGLIVMLLLILIILGTVFGLLYRKSSSSSFSPPEELATTTTSTSTPPPTWAPSGILNLESANYLVTILRPYTPVWILFDDTMPQGRAFSALLHSEVAATYNTPPAQVLQRYSLLVLYYDTGGMKSWFQKWNVLEPDECTWFGVGSCRTISINNNNTTSTTTTASTLMAVGQLNIVSNNMRGTIPSELCLLGQSVLLGLNLSNNLLTGTLPPCLVQLVNLTTLDLHNNLLHGSLPPLGYSPFLQTVDLSYNKFSGTIDDIFQPTNTLSVLTTLLLQHNQFTGTVPTVLSPTQNQALTTISLVDNPNITGQVPFCLSTLSVDCQYVDCPCCSNCAAR